MKNIFGILILVFFVSSCSSDDDKELKYEIDENASLRSKNLMSSNNSEKFVERFLSTLPQAIENNIWTKPEYSPAENILLRGSLQDYESYSIGSKAKQGLSINSQPIIAEGKIFTLDGMGKIQARPFDNPGKILWEKSFEQEYLSKNRDYGFYRRFTNFFYDAEEFLGGTISYGIGNLFLSTRRGNIYSIDPEKGEVIWQKNMGVPIRSSITSAQDKIIFITIDNKTHTLNKADGQKIWTHNGVDEKSKLSGSPSPLIIKNDVIVPYSSGDVHSLKISSGFDNWNALTSPSSISILNPSINDVSRTPIYHKNTIFVVTSDGRIVALDKVGGYVIWELDGFSIVNNIWPVSDFIFAVTNDHKLISVSLTTGEVVWTSDLADKEFLDDNSEDIFFTSPIVANGSIYVADNMGNLRQYRTKDGSIVSSFEILDDVYVSPIIAKGKMIMVNDDAKLSIME